MSISIQGLNKAAVLAALYNASKPQGMGFMHYDAKPMTTEEAQQLLDSDPCQYFDYLKGRVMKIGLSKEEDVNTWGYNRDNGENAAEKVIETLRQSGDVNAESIKQTHAKNTLAAGIDVEQRLDDESRMEGGNLHLGLSDVKEHLGPAVRKVVGNRN